MMLRLSNKNSKIASPLILRYFIRFRVYWITTSFILPRAVALLGAPSELFLKQGAPIVNVEKTQKLLNRIKVLLITRNFKKSRYIKDIRDDINWLKRLK